jgi:TetR/AcrR family transcriptional repressor of bet genes
MPRRYSMAKRAKLTERTRRDIEMALVRLLSTKSYRAVGMADIAQEADVAVRTVQRHYGSKDDVLAAAVRYPAQAMSEELSKRPPGRSPREDLQSLVASLFAIYDRHRREMWAAYTRSADAPELMQALLVAGGAWLSAVDALLARWSQRCAVDPILAKRAIVALTSYPTWRGLVGAGGFGSPEAETIVARLLHHLIFEPGETP